MSGSVAGSQAADALMRDKEELARAVTRRLYFEFPDLLERHGERGREKCLQDMRYNIEHLIPAVDLGRAMMFADYVRWLDGLLRARGVATRDVRRCLELVSDEARSRYDEATAGAIATIVDAGLAVVEASE